MEQMLPFVTLQSPSTHALVYQCFSMNSAWFRDSNLTIKVSISLRCSLSLMTAFGITAVNVCLPVCLSLPLPAYDGVTVCTSDGSGCGDLLFCDHLPLLPDMPHPLHPTHQFPGYPTQWFFLGVRTSPQQQLSVTAAMGLVLHVCSRGPLRTPKRCLRVGSEVPGSNSNLCECWWPLV